jgi:hypothetical protein
MHSLPSEATIPPESYQSGSDLEMPSADTPHCSERQFGIFWTRHVIFHTVVFTDLFRSGYERERIYAIVVKQIG